MTNTPLPISWEKFYKVQASLLEQIKSSGKSYTYIVTIPCGGLMPAYVLAKALDLPIVTINLKSYDGQESGDLQHITIDGFTDTILNQQEALIVDDMYDTGKTIKYLQEKYPNTDTAVTFARYSDHTATFTGEVLGHDTWIDFPWEVT